MIKKKKKADLTNLKSETTTNQEQGKNIEADMTLGCIHSAVRRSNGGGVVEQRRFLLSLHACLNIMTPKGKQDYVRCITERARELMESSRKTKKKKKRESRK